MTNDFELVEMRSGSFKLFHSCQSLFPRLTSRKRKKVEIQLLSWCAVRKVPPPPQPQGTPFPSPQGTPILWRHWPPPPAPLRCLQNSTDHVSFFRCQEIWRGGTKVPSESFTRCFIFSWDPPPMTSLHQSSSSNIFQQQNCSDSEIPCAVAPWNTKWHSKIQIRHIIPICFSSSVWKVPNRKCNSTVSSGPVNVKEEVSQVVVVLKTFYFTLSFWWSKIKKKTNTTITWGCYSMMGCHLTMPHPRMA